MALAISRAQIHASNVDIRKGTFMTTANVTAGGGLTPSAHRIVVGIDASDYSREALRWAISFSQPGDTIELVHAWDLPAVAGVEALDLEPGPFAVAADRLLRDAADEVLEDEERQLVDLVFSPVNGRPAGALVQKSEDAELIVVGRRGRGGFRSLLIGSVSHEVVHHARCPVVVTPLSSSAVRPAAAEEVPTPSSTTTEGNRT